MPPHVCKVRVQDIRLLAAVLDVYRDNAPALQLSARLSSLLLSLCDAPLIPSIRRDIPSLDPVRDQLLEEINNSKTRNKR